MYTRECPSCHELVYHKTKYSRNAIQKQNRQCIRCSGKEKYKDNKNFQKQSKLGKFGEDNPFFGKKHNENTIEKIKKSREKQEFSKETREKISKKSSGKNNPMYGKNIYQTWLEKYGKDIADQKLIDLKDKQSISSSGKNNPMYGKPTPKKAGNGWSGWYKNHFFRSLRELSYIVLELKDKEWISAENIRIKYTDYLGTERTYAPDFLVQNKYLVEIKPERLINSPLVSDKTKAAIKYCEENGLEFLITDTIILNREEIENLISLGEVLFTEASQKKMKDYFKKENLCLKG